MSVLQQMLMPMMALRKEHGDFVFKVEFSTQLNIVDTIVRFTVAVDKLESHINVSLNDVLYYGDNKVDFGVLMSMLSDHLSKQKGKVFNQED